VETSKSTAEEKYREEVRKVNINGREYTFDPLERIFGLKGPLEESKHKSNDKCK
jgi:hypothetical protein